MHLATHERGALGLAFALALACTPEPEESTPTAEQILQDQLDALPPDAIDCGHVETSLDCEPLRPQLDALETCLRDALTACEPAVARIDAHTIEGYSNPELYLVDDDCTMTMLVDWTDDPYGGCRLWQRTCTEIIDIQGCPSFHIPCDDDETLLQLESCDTG